MTITRYEDIKHLDICRGEYKALRELAEQEDAQLKQCDNPDCNTVFVTHFLFSGTMKDNTDRCIVCSGKLKSMGHRSKRWVR